jgi:hypothetical protein
MTSAFSSTNPVFGENASALPESWRQIGRRTAALGFDMPSEADTGAMLRPPGRSASPADACWSSAPARAWPRPALRRGWALTATLVSVDNDARVQAVAREALGEGSARDLRRRGRSRLHVRAQAPASFDLIFADAWPGKYDGLDETLALLRPGGLYVVDDMLPQPNWPDNHQARVDDLTARLKSHPDLATVSLSWASGLIIAARRS